MVYINQSQSVILIAILLICSGCATVYVPNAAHTPLMEEQGEVHVSAHFGSQGGDLQLGYALTDQFGIIAGISGRENTNQDGEETGNHTFGEAGVVWFPDIHQRLKNEFIGGIGLGNAKGESSFSFMNPQGEYEKRTAKGDFYRIFVQSNTALTSSVVTTGIATRLAFVNFYNYELTGSQQAIRNRTSALFFEPAAFVRLGFRNVKFESQVGISRPIGDFRNIAFDYEFMRASFGVHFYFNTR
jgi:hypothetical protein